jgi:hypothetical protein
MSTLIASDLMRTSSQWRATSSRRLLPWRSFSLDWNSIRHLKETLSLAGYMVIDQRKPASSLPKSLGFINRSETHPLSLFGRLHA